MHPPKAAVCKPVPKIITLEHVKPAQEREQQGDARLRGEATLDRGEFREPFLGRLLAHAGKQHRRHEPHAADPNDDGEQVDRARDDAPVGNESVGGHGGDLLRGSGLKWVMLRFR